MCSWCKNPLNRIVIALPISEIQQEQLTEEEEENGKRRQSDDSNAALDDSTMELNMSSEVDEVDVVRLMRQCCCFKWKKTKPLQFWKANSQRFPFLSIVSRNRVGAKIRDCF
jgi:hypothetical protein